MFLSHLLTAECYYGFYLLLLFAQMILLLFAIFRKSELLWRCLLGLELFSLVVAFVGPGRTATPVNEFVVIAAWFLYGIVFLTSLLIRTAFIRTMGKGTFWTAVWIISALAVLIGLVVYL